jgi:hypothetical protein
MYRLGNESEIIVTGLPDVSEKKFRVRSFHYVNFQVDITSFMDEYLKGVEK